jgi:predicted TPR repeat methyltransferase
LLEALTEAVPDCAPGWLYRAQFAEAVGDRTAAAAALDRLAALKASEPEIRKEAQAMRRRLRGGR